MSKMKMKKQKCFHQMNENEKAKDKMFSPNE
jgi:hypothetical protein